MCACARLHHQFALSIYGFSKGVPGSLSLCATLPIKKKKMATDVTVVVKTDWGGVMTEGL